MSKRPEESLAGMIDALKEKTGKTLDEWHALVDKVGHEKHGEILNFLKATHNVSHGYANQIALRIRDRRAPASSDDPIDSIFAGPKATMRPLFDKVIAEITNFGKDIDIAPKKAYVSVRRSKQFAILQPSATRLDIGVNLKGTESGGRLEPSGSFNAMVSHRVKLGSPTDIDAELVGWLKSAYEGA